MLVDQERALRELNIPEKMFKDLLQVFIEQAQECLDKLEDALSRRDYDEIRKAAHFIHGSSGNLRIEKIRESARNIEMDALETRDVSTMEKHVQELKCIFNDVKKEVLYGRI